MRTEVKTVFNPYRHFQARHHALTVLADLYPEILRSLPSGLASYEIYGSPGGVTNVLHDEPMVIYDFKDASRHLIPLARTYMHPCRPWG